MGVGGQSRIGKKTFIARDVRDLPRTGNRCPSEEDIVPSNTEEARAFVLELVETLRAANAVDNPAPVNR